MSSSRKKADEQFNEYKQNFLDLVVTPFVEKTSKEFVRIKLHTGDGTPFDSKVCGTPYLPNGFDYPTVREGEYSGKPIRFLAQINFEQAPHIDNFPDKGILQFYALDDGAVGMDFDDATNQNAFRIVYHEEVDYNAQQQNVPEGTKIEDLYPISCPLLMDFEISTMPLCSTDFRFSEKNLFIDLYNKAFPEHTVESFYDIDEKLIDMSCDILNVNGHMFGGYSYFTQADPREYDDCKDKTVQLLQIDSEFENGVDWEIMWGDVGVGNFLISESDLKNCDFSNVLYTWDCC